MRLFLVIDAFSIFFSHTCSDHSYNCTDCKESETYRYLTASNTCPCNIGYFDAGFKNCRECDYTCYKCDTDKNNCLECNDDVTKRWLDVDTCPCSDGWTNNDYEEEESICIPCHYTWFYLKKY